MATNIQVSFINKRLRKSLHQRVASIGGIADGTEWKVSEQEAIAAIRSGAYRFYVAIGGRNLEIIVASHEGRHYLKTSEDDHASNQLLNLPERLEPLVAMAGRLNWSAKSFSPIPNTALAMPDISAAFAGRTRVPQGRRRRAE